MFMLFFEVHGDHPDLHVPTHSFPTRRSSDLFERMLRYDGVRIAKIFLHITADEQLDRFKARLDNPFKRWKLSYEDFRNRRRWRDYEQAIEDMIARTSTSRAPWCVVPAR